MKLQKEQQENINEISLQDKFSHLYWNPSKNGRKVQQTWWQRDQRLLIFVYLSCNSVKRLGEAFTTQYYFNRSKAIP